MTTKELIRDEIRKWQSNIEAKCPESTSSRNYTKEEWNAIYEYNAYTRILSFLDTLPDGPVTDCHELTEAAENPYVLNDVSHAAFEYERTRNDLDARSDNEVVRRAFKAGAEWMKRKMMEGATYNELMELYRAIRDELVKRHCDVPVNIKEEQ